MALPFAHHIGTYAHYMGVSYAYNVWDALCAQCGGGGGNAHNVGAGVAGQRV